MQYVNGSNLLQFVKMTMDDLLTAVNVLVFEGLRCKDWPICNSAQRKV